ncbi:MAG: hypothetical protein HRT54_24290, partial [Colwellia sp.]|nr:hypothetical protein [Colwellia sp.]
LVLRLIDHKYSVLIRKSDQNVFTQSVKEAEFIECEANVGDLLIMRPLILHASSKAKFPKHRRVIHMEFSSYDLPNDVYWK